ncbi:MAG: CBS domain-containing protein [Spirochaetota bacterium]
MKTVKDILQNKTIKEIWSVSPKAFVYDALVLMNEKGIGAVLVMDEKEKIAGIFSERDYARKIIIKGKSSKETKVEEVMTPASKMYTVKPDSPLEECMALATEKHIRHLPVFEQGKFIGLISTGDIVKILISEKQDLINQLSDYIAGIYT